MIPMEQVVKKAANRVGARAWTKDTSCTSELRRDTIRYDTILSELRRTHSAQGHG